MFECLPVLSLRMEEVDHSSAPGASRDRPSKKRSLSAHLVGVGGVSEGGKELMEENTQLQTRISALVKVSYTCAQMYMYGGAPWVYLQIQMYFS